MSQSLPTEAVQACFFATAQHLRVVDKGDQCRLRGMISTYIVLGPNDAMFAKFGLAMTVVVWAPIFEEVVTSLPLWWETATKRCWWFVDGALLSAACGAGFAIRETLFDMGKGDTADSLGLVVARSLAVPHP